MKLLKLNLRNEDILSKTQMKNILGGVEAVGTRCVYYCCPDDGGPCSTGVSVTESCTSNEDCQSQNHGGHQCSIGYLAALCKN